MPSLLASAMARLGARSPFTIPSGVVATAPAVIARLAREIPELGFVTTKTISLEPRTGYREPIIYEYYPGCFVNAVGLANPGAPAFLEAMEPLLPLHGGKALLVSIMGSDPAEFLECATMLDPIADAFELNLSCPHVKGAGQAVGSDPDAVRTVLGLLKARLDKPIIPKLSPNLGDVAEMARLCQEAGADAIALINTVGPGLATDREGNPVLSNVVGGLSGSGVLPIGIRAVRDAAAAVTIPIIASGGIASADDVRAYARAGASLFAVGSGLAGMSTPEIVDFFRRLVNELEDCSPSLPCEAATHDANRQYPGATSERVHQEHGLADTPCSKSFRKGVRGTTLLQKGFPRNSYLSESNLVSRRTRTEYFKTAVVENAVMGAGIFRLTLERGIECDPGQFFFLRIPGQGEKPFSPAVDMPPTYFVRTVGAFTEALACLEPGAEIFMRGPYGRGFPELAPGDSLILVGGGTGIAPVLMAGMRWESHVRGCFFGFSREIGPEFRAYLSQQVPESRVLIDPPESPGEVVRAVTHDLVLHPGDYESVRIYVCGPAQMMGALVRVFEGKIPPNRIFLAREDIMRCGIGLCGSCATEDGLRSCVDGPVMNPG